MADEVAPEQLVERLHRRGLGQRGSGRCQVRLEWVAGHGGSLQHPASAAREQRELLRQGRHNRGWDLHARERDAGGVRTLGLAPRCARQLLEVERVAAALLVYRAADFGAEELTGLVRAQRLELEASQQAGPVRPSKRTGQALRYRTRTQGQGDQHGGGRRTPQQRADQLDRAGIGPVQVVQ